MAVQKLAEIARVRLAATLLTITSGWIQLVGQKMWKLEAKYVLHIFHVPNRSLPREKKFEVYKIEISEKKLKNRNRFHEINVFSDLYLKDQFAFFLRNAWIKTI